jgi:uncharacterized protein YdiU (UPF0061 family)
LVADVDPLEKALEAFEPAYRAAFPAKILRILGLQAVGVEEDLVLLKALFGWMGETKASWPQVFFDWFCGAASEGRAAASPIASLYREPGFDPVRKALLGHQPERPERLGHAYFHDERPASMLIEQVESLWQSIAEADDWAPFYAHMSRIETARQALDLR